MVAGNIATSTTSTACFSYVQLQFDSSPHSLTVMKHNLTSQAAAARTDPPKRPFVLTRSFYAGSQRFGAMWTGDNLGTWDHMAVGVKMVLANNIAGFSFAGCA